MLNGRVNTFTIKLTFTSDGIAGAVPGWAGKRLSERRFSLLAERPPVGPGPDDHFFGGSFVSTCSFRSATTASSSFSPRMFL